METKSGGLLIWPAVIAVTAMLLALLSWPYGMYTLLKGVTAVVAAYYAYDVHTRFQSFGIWFWIMVAVALFLNPIIPVYLYSQSLWQMVDVIVAVVFITLISSQKHG